MVLGWRKAFCTSIQKDRTGKQEKIHTFSSSSSGDHHQSNPATPKLSSRLSFFSNPSTPRLHQCQPPSSPRLRCRTTSTAPSTPPAVQPPPQSPKLKCKATGKNSPRFFQRSSNPSSPSSPSTFSLLKSTLRLSNNKTKCGICLHNVKSGQGTAIFTAECSHSFHFPCVAVHVRKQGTLTCPVCRSQWTEMPLLSLHNVRHRNLREEGKNMEFPSSPKTPLYLTHHHSNGKSSALLKVYNDDEPLMSPTWGARFNPIPESDENEEDNITEEFQGFKTTFTSPLFQKTSTASGSVETSLSPESVVVSVGRGFQTCVAVLHVRAPQAPATAARRAPIDLVAVVDVSGKMTNEKLQMVKRAMRLVVSSMSAADRISIVAFSSTSKRLLPLRRMTTEGRRSARRIVDAMVALDGTAVASASDALKKAAKVLEDRRERNPVASIILLSDDHRSHHRSQRRQSSIMYATRITHLNVPVLSVGFYHGGACGYTQPPEDALAKCVRGLLSVMVQDLRIHLGSNQAEILGVYSHAGRPVALGSGVVRLGQMFAGEERELMVELKVPSSISSPLGPHHVLAVRCTYKDPSTQEPIQVKEQALLVPRPFATARSTTTTSVERLRSLFVATRAVAESRKLVERNDLTGAQQMLSSARGLVLQQTSSSGSTEEFARGLEAELMDLHWRRQQSQEQVRRRQNVERRATNAEEKSGEPITPTSAWRAAERLAKVAIMRKSMNRVSDLHGFENARF